ncbi:relaxase/mobilization nuclease domain-containing protein [Puniceicoccaceae bacterium K14]|nr:relaxase/mobilization nuclease domain-containing protein [Puniceicoccaceae bacterium K14]
MNPHIAKHGRSFKGAWEYYMHDPKSETRERVEWAMTCNMMTDDPDKAWKVMAYTAKVQSRLKEASGQVRTGNKAQKPVMAYSLSWHPDHDPDKEHMEETALQSIKELGMEEHEAIIVAHRDTPHRHVHVIVNTIHPITGLVNTTPYSQNRLSKFCGAYQKQHGMDYCPQREENRKKREEGKNAKYRNPVISEAWASSDSGQSFAAALEEKGYKLAQGRKRLVVVDPYGKTHNPVRHIEGIKTKDFNARLADIDRESLRDADELAKEAQAQHEAMKRELAEKAPALRKDFGDAKAKPAPDLKAEFDKHNGNLATPKNKQKTEMQHSKAAEQKPLRDKFDEQLSRLTHAHKIREATTRRELQEYYRLWEHKEQINALEQKVNGASWWRKLFRLNRKAENELSSLRFSFDNMKKRYNEQLRSLKNEFSNAEDALRKQHGKPPKEKTTKLSQDHDKASNPTHEQERQKRIAYIRDRQRQRQTRGRGRGGGPRNE